MACFCMANQVFEVHVAIPSQPRPQASCFSSLITEKFGSEQSGKKGGAKREKRDSFFAPRFCRSTLNQTSL